MTVEARRATGEALRVTSESFAIATIASDADRRCRRALLEEWVGRETASFRLPPSRLALDPGDVVQLDHDGRLTSLRLTSHRRCRRAPRRGGAHRRRRLRAGARTRAGAAGAEAGGLRTAERGVPRPAAAPRERRRRTSRSRPSTPCPGRAGSRSGAARARTASSWSPRSAGRRGWDARRRSLSRADVALRPRQRRHRRSRLRHARERHRRGALRRRQRAGGRGGARRLGGAAVRRRRADRAGALPAVAAAARPARHRGRHGQRRRRPARGSSCSTRRWRRCRSPRRRSGWRPTGGSGRRRSRSATGRTGRSSFTPEGVGLRPFSVGHVEQPWRTAREPGDLVIRWTRRSRALAADSWTAPEVPLAEETRGLRGRDPRRRHREADAEHRHDQRHLHRRPADSPTGARCSAPATRSTSASSSSPPSSGAAPRNPSPSQF